MGNKCCGHDKDDIANFNDGKGRVRKPAKRQKELQPDGSIIGVYKNSVGTLSAGSTVSSPSRQFDNLFEPSEAIRKEDFEYLCVIGRGTFGKVYQVRKKSNQKIFAMKILRKDKIIQMRLIPKIKAEREILQNNTNPYIVNLHYAFQTDTKLYLVMDFVNGGELFTYLNREKKFKLDRVKQYAAELVDAISYLHNNGVLYRDLKPENVLLDSDGHIRIIDFGLAKINMKPNQKTYSFCGTPEYMAPEIASSRGHSFSSDWYSLGTLIYEMLAGQPPHYDSDKFVMLQTRINNPVTMKKFFTAETKSLLLGMLEQDPKHRFGAEEIKAHEFFKEINWDDVSNRRNKVVFVPELAGSADIQNIDSQFTRESLKETYIDRESVIQLLPKADIKKLNFS